MEGYAGKQFVGIALHRRRTVIVRTTGRGEVLEGVRIVNAVQRLASGISRARWWPGVVGARWGMVVQVGACVEGASWAAGTCWMCGRMTRFVTRCE